MEDNIFKTIRESLYPKITKEEKAGSVSYTAEYPTGKWCFSMHDSMPLASVLKPIFDSMVRKDDKTEFDESILDRL